MESVKIEKKVNRHVLKAINLLQMTKRDFVHIKDIQDCTRRSLRYTKPVNNLEEAIEKSLSVQTDLGIVTRSGRSKYGLALSFQGLRSERCAQIHRSQARFQSTDSLTADELVKVRKILHGGKNLSAKKNAAVVTPNTSKASKTIYKKKSILINSKVKNSSEKRRVCSNCLKQVANQTNTPVRDLSVGGIPKAVRFDMDIEEDYEIIVPKKVNRHVYKVVRHFTEKEKYEFVPLDIIQEKVMWAMRKLNPVNNIEKVIERSLRTLSNMGVLSERNKSYRFNRVQSLDQMSSISLFGNFRSFFPDLQKGFIASIDEQVEGSRDSVYQATQSCTYPREESLTRPTTFNVRPREIFFGVESNDSCSQQIQNGAESQNVLNENLEMSLNESKPPLYPYIPEETQSANIFGNDSYFPSMAAPREMHSNFYFGGASNFQTTSALAFTNIGPFGGLFGTNFQADETSPSAATETIAIVHQEPSKNG